MLDPLHPAVVHLPLGVVVLLPLFAVGALIAGARGTRPGRAWSLVVALHAVLAASAWLALRTGGEEEDRVERVVPKAALEEHEEAGERLWMLALAGFAVSGAGLFGGRFGVGARRVGATFTLVLLWAGWATGHSGGELVYRHGAAGAYAGGAPEAAPHREHEGR